MRWLVMAAALAWIAAPVHAENVALTFDDLPVFGRPASTADATAITTKLLAELNRCRLPATGFVNEIKLEGADKVKRIALLVDWLNAGMDLGNHSYSHLSLTTTPVDDYIADVARGEIVTRTLLAELGRTPRWYRHPYLETGPTLEIRQRFESWLTAHGYRVAPVTMENSDWQFALPYDVAVEQGEASKARRIRQAYLQFTARSVQWYRDAALGLLGRRPAFIFLLHASRLNADSIGALAAILRKQQLHPVSLDQAIADPAYALVDTYAGPNGNQWLTRWARLLNKQLPWRSLPAVPADIAAEDSELEAAPGVTPDAPPNSKKPR
jgi:peptidoglycan/xylan/chitin deacetylase (PgdA/CDA1 family)